MSDEPRIDRVAAVLSDGAVLEAWLALKCAACGLGKPSRESFCPTCMIALTIWDRIKLTKFHGDAGEALAQFGEHFRASLRHLRLNPQRKVKLPARRGDSWKYETADQLEAAGFKFIGHFECRVPQCGAKITLYWTPVTQVKMAVNFVDLRPHRESCKDPDYWRRRKEEKRAQASARRKNRQRRRA